MPRIASESKHLFTFVKGLVTEATGVTAPENAMVDGDNVDIGISGICQRRKGLDLESGYNLSTASTTAFSAADVANNAITIHEWKSVDGDGSVNLWVMQFGTTLFVASPCALLPAFDRAFSIISSTALLIAFLDRVAFISSQLRLRIPSSSRNGEDLN